MFIEKNGAIYVDCYACELYLPYDYMEKAYRGNAYYTPLGNKVRCFAVGNMRFYKNEKEMESPLTVKSYPLGVPVMIITEPTEIDTREVQLSREVAPAKCIVLTYYKNDKFIVNSECITSTDNAMIILDRLESGKMDHVSPTVAASIFHDVQDMNKINFRIPSEVEEIFVSERYRNPNKHSQKARFAPAKDAEHAISYNMRQDAMQSTTYQAVTHEDINTALIVSVNRKEEGKVDPPTTMERIVRGLPMDDLIEERDKRREKTKEVLGIDDSIEDAYEVDEHHGE